MRLLKLLAECIADYAVYRNIAQHYFQLMCFPPPLPFWWSIKSSGVPICDSKPAVLRMPSSQSAAPLF